MSGTEKTVENSGKNRMASKCDNCGHSYDEPATAPATLAAAGDENCLNIVDLRKVVYEAHQAREMLGNVLKEFFKQTQKRRRHHHGGSQRSSSRSRSISRSSSHSRHDGLKVKDRKKPEQSKCSKRKSQRSVSSSSSSSSSSNSNDEVVSMPDVNLLNIEEAQPQLNVQEANQKSRGGHHRRDRSRSLSKSRGHSRGRSCGNSRGLSRGHSRGRSRGHLYGRHHGHSRKQNRKNLCGNSRGYSGGRSHERSRSRSLTKILSRNFASFFDRKHHRHTFERPDRRHDLGQGLYHGAGPINGSGSHHGPAAHHSFRPNPRYDLFWMRCGSPNAILAARNRVKTREPIVVDLTNISGDLVEGRQIAATI